MPISPEGQMEDVQKNSSEVNNLYNEVDTKEGKNFFSDFAGSENDQPMFVEKMVEFRKERNKILDVTSGEDRNVKIAKLESVKEKLTRPAIARMKWMIENPESIRQVGALGNKETFEAITSILAGTGEIGKYFDELKKLRESMLKEDSRHKEFPELSI